MAVRVPIAYDNHGDHDTEPMGWRSLACERLLESGQSDSAWDTIVGEERCVQVT